MKANLIYDASSVRNDAGHASSYKWLLLLLQCLLSAMNQALCFSYAPISRIADTAWQHEVHSSSLITIFFLVYLPFAFLGSWILDLRGWRVGVLLGAFVQAVGAIFRAVSSNMDMAFPIAKVFLIIGQVLAAIGMPFMVNSPPVLSALWFPPHLRARVTSMGVNSNQLGIVAVYLAAPVLVAGPADLAKWDRLLAMSATALFLLAFVCFRVPKYPPMIPSASGAYDYRQWVTAFHHPGFSLTVFVFAVAEMAENVLAALLNRLASPQHGFARTTQGAMGAAFILSSVLGGFLVGSCVDASGSHKAAIVVCSLVAGGLLLGFGYVVAAVDVTWHVSGSFALLVAFGFFLGPLHPIAVELGAECAHPTSEATVAALQQLLGNALSALLLPLLSLLQHWLEGNAAAALIDDDDEDDSSSSSDGPTVLGQWWQLLATPVGVVSLLLLFAGIIFTQYRGAWKRSQYAAVPPGRPHLGI
ncbi:hypothetical protein SPRG_08179 [Saprolegnia parasitica CBS 223.65]|uniref:Major facilitator superfamily (MFS) profile domain-containing protein n=1 Tax=Saprolegnia parasitica (strain CBS 223.65) TaxID=695850 RepID=A0A067CIK8_SAPPC|nr:hypothetical protein SPRG_08179 [Saprolegnia parasitica CBS 223.65]KDO26376.1 hypothetical protein SPRG_08179 [Saprolegnia parasitica CBS 223.65]|eukprot:XP_012202814.1 hypothetical protein SPRG_08179 [Saprolegnia parasitica CBS 223.65]